MSNVTLLPTSRTAQADLEVKVETLLADIVRLGHEKLAALVASANADPVGNHAERDLNWVTPKLFIAALGKEIALQYGMTEPTREGTAELNRYHQEM